MHGLLKIGLSIWIYVLQDTFYSFEIPGIFLKRLLLKMELKKMLLRSVCSVFDDFNNALENVFHLSKYSIFHHGPYTCIRFVFSYIKILIFQRRPNILLCGVKNVQILRLILVAHMKEGIVFVNILCPYKNYIIVHVQH